MNTAFAYCIGPWHGHDSAAMRFALEHVEPLFRDSVAPLPIDQHAVPASDELAYRRRYRISLEQATHTGLPVLWPTYQRRWTS